MKNTITNMKKMVTNKMHTNKYTIQKQEQDLKQNTGTHGKAYTEKNVI